jgi:hypothetical protein
VTINYSQKLLVVFCSLILFSGNTSPVFGGGPDTEAPVIAPHGDENAEATSASGAIVSYTSPATSDNIDPPGVATCAPLSGTTFAIGNTTVTCDATDVAGNPAISTTFDVIVSDIGPPVITPIGVNATIPFGSVYTELGGNVTDNDPAYSEAVTVGGDTVNTFISADYIITYNAPDDAAGNTPDEKTITITVLPDAEKPVITPIGVNAKIPLDSTYVELGGTVTDNDPAYSETVTVGGDTVDTSTLGNYIITYNAPADAAGNTPDEKTITITVESISISIDDVAQVEGDSGTSNFIFAVERSSKIGAVSVQFQTGDNTATSPSDYAPLSLTALNFTDNGPKILTISVPVKGDVTVESAETFFVNLSSCIGCVIVDNQGVGTILDDDGTGSANDLDLDGIPDTIDTENIINSSRTITTSHTVIGNITVQNGAVLTIPNGFSVTIIPGSSITIESGSGVLIKSGGTLEVIS